MLEKLEQRHRGKLASLLAAIPQFTAEEVAVALELVDEGLAKPDSGDYRFLLLAEEHTGNLHGYACYGPTPMTEGCFDLYWLAIHPSAQHKGRGTYLLAAVEHELAREGARLLRVETAGLDAYTATRRFYQNAGYEVAGRVRDFYWRGNDLYIFAKYLESGPPPPR